MKTFIQLTIIFTAVFLIYFGVNSHFTFRPAWSVDYFNSLAQSIRSGRLDLVHPQQTYDLVEYQKKWYAPWGALSALFLIPMQILKGRFVPSAYLSFFFGSLNTCIVWLLARRIRQEYFPALRTMDIYAVTILYAFGTANFYVGTLGSVWHVDQMVSTFFGNLGVYSIFKQKRNIRDYVLSSWSIMVTLVGRATLSMLLILPVLFFLRDYVQKRKFIILGAKIFGPAIVACISLFFWYNYARFGNILEYGYRYIHEAPNLEAIRLRNGAMSLVNLPTNVWYMVAEVPKISLDPVLHMDINLKGNSIFFLTPSFLAIFLASPLTLFSGILWITVIATLLPSLMIYSTGWMQFGYRYSLDITMLLVILSLFGLKGKLNALYYMSIVFSCVMYIWGIRILQ